MMNGQQCHFCGAIAQSNLADSAAPIALSIIIPIYNEATQLNHNLNRIHQVVGAIDVVSEFILIDDGSSDQTWQEIGALHDSLPAVTGLRLSRNFGKEAAISAGLSFARGRACVVMDSDLQHPPALIPEMVARWKEGWEIVEGLKVTRGKESPFNKLAARFFYWLLSWLSGYNLYGASDFKLLDRKVITAWQSMRERNLFFRGMIAWVGYRRTQLLFEVPDRVETKSRWSLLQLFRLALGAITAFSSLPLHLVTALGLLFLLCSFVFGVYALALFFRGLAVPGFTTVILLELLIGGVLMTSLGIIGTYIGRLYEEAKDRPRFIVAAELSARHLQKHRESGAEISHTPA